MPNSDTLPEGTDAIIDGDGIEDAGGAHEGSKIGEETLFTPDEEPEETKRSSGDSRGGGDPNGDSRSSGDSRSGGGSRSSGDSRGGSTGGGSTTGATFGTTALFDRIDEWKAQGYDRAREYAQSGIEKGTTAIDDVVRMINEAADQIDERVGAQYGGYARRAAEGIGGFGDMLKGKDVDELFDQARDIVRKSPAVAIGTAAALGFVVARMARAGMPESDSTANGGKGGGGGKPSGGAA